MRNSTTPIRRHLLLSLVVWCAWLSPTAVGLAQDQDAEIPGLIARYSAGNQQTERIDRDVQFDWQSAAPDSKLPAGAFSAAWRGRLQLRIRGNPSFHLYLAGEAEVRVDGKRVVAGRRETAGWVVGDPVEIEASEPTIEVTYQKVGEQAVVRLFWTADSFPLEPIPAQFLFHTESNQTAELVARGRELYSALRCAACHNELMGESLEKAPALQHRGVRLNSAWLIDWLTHSPQKLPTIRMPDFGFSKEEAALIARALTASKPDEPATLLLNDEQRTEAIRRGKVLFHSVGCLACHTFNDLGTDSPRSGGNLTEIGRKRSFSWIEQWLADPTKVNVDHQMPTFALKEDERRDLALFLTQRKQSNDAPLAPELSDTEKKQARSLMETARCVACHRIDGEWRPLTSKRLFDQPVSDSSKSCLTGAADPAHQRPSFSLSPDDRTALRAFIEPGVGRRSPTSLYAQGELLLRQKGCLNCHDRDGQRGLSSFARQIVQAEPELARQSETMIPPSLTAVGDKLRDDALNSAISGRQDSVRLPWLRVRMPRFDHSQADTDALRKYLHSHDRIPAGFSEAASISKKSDDPDEPAAARHARLRAAGQVLAGTRGFSCTACHKIAGHEPRNVALATRGSDLYLLGRRMRPEYFERWTRSPLRIVPGMEMPAFERPVSGVLKDNLDHQFAALWEVLNDNSTPPKIDTSTIEQSIVVAVGEKPKIVRDVFNIGDPLALVFVPRGFAVGLENGFSALFDLDTMSLSGWWDGGLARQRAAGKSWYWEPFVGPQSTSAKLVKPQEPDLFLVRNGNESEPIKAIQRAGRFGRLIRYNVPPTRKSIRGTPKLSRAVRLEYELSFPSEGQEIQVRVTETWHPIKMNPAKAAVDSNSKDSPAPQAAEQSGNASGNRFVAVTGVPDGFSVRMTRGTGDTNVIIPIASSGNGKSATFSQRYFGSQASSPPAPSSPAGTTEKVISVPGYDGSRLPFPILVMPTAMTFLPDGALAFCTLKGQVYMARDTDGDGVEDKLTLFEEGLAAPYGLIADGNDLIVAQKPDLIRLRDTDGDGQADVREVVASGWGFTEDYHDWTTGIVRDSLGNLYVGTGSDYAKAGRSREQGLWRGKVLRIDRRGTVTPLGHALRYPTGLAINADDQIFVSDNQGVQNPFNEINHLVAGASYGVPSLFEENPNAPTARSRD